MAVPFESLFHREDYKYVETNLNQWGDRPTEHIEVIRVIRGSAHRMASAPPAGVTTTIALGDRPIDH